MSIVAEYFGTSISDISQAVGLVGVVVGIVALIVASTLSSRVAKLEQQLRNLRRDPIPPRPPAARPLPMPQPKPVPTTPPAPASPVTTPTVATSPDSPDTTPPHPASVPHATAPAKSIPAHLTPPRRSMPPKTHRTPANERGFERFMGTKMLVWLGGLALAIACGFFVHHAFSNNWVTPEIRILGGAAFGVALLIVADRLKSKANVVAQACSGAGIACLYTVIYSAFYFYSFINSPVAFLLSVVVTAVAVVLALRHGPFTAVLGLFGGFTMPILLRTGEPVDGVFFGYLIFLQLALVAVGRHRGTGGWLALTWLSLGAGTLWGISSALALFPISHRVWPEVLFMGMAGVYVFAAWPGGEKNAIGKGLPGWFGVLGAGVSLLLMVVHVGIGTYEPRGLGMLGLMAAAALALGRLDLRLARLPWAALLAVVGMLLAYAEWGRQEAVEKPGPFLQSYAVAAVGYGVVMVLGAWACSWRSKKPGGWAWLSAVSGGAIYLISLIWLWELVADGFAWWGIAAALGGVLLLMATLRYVALGRAHTQTSDGNAEDLIPGAGADVAVNVWASAVVGFALAAVGLAWYDDAPWMRIGWAGLALIAVAVHFRLQLTCLRKAAVLLAALVGCCAVYPGPFFEPLATTAVFNGLLLGYGVSAGLLAAAAWWAHRRKDADLSGALQLVMVFVVAVGSYVLTRHAFTGGAGEWQFEKLSLIESATHSVSWLTLGLGTAVLGIRWRQKVLRAGGVIIGLAGVYAALVGSVILLNPLGHSDSVGSVIIFNELLFIYLLPALLCLGFAMLADRLCVTPKAASIVTGVWGVACLLLVFAWVSLNVRQGFVGPVLDLDKTRVTDAEWYAYSMAWVGLGVALLVVGIVTRSATARWGSLAVMLVTVVKVFIFDAAGLEDLYRVLSFFGLGVSLIGLGYVYQRFVFRRPESETTELVEHETESQEPPT